MKIGIREFAALGIMAISVAFAGVAIDQSLIERQAWSWRRPPWFAVFIGIIFIGTALYALAEGAMGRPKVNGRRERPIVFWSIFVMLLAFGFGFLIIGASAFVDDWGNSK